MASACFRQKHNGRFYGNTGGFTLSGGITTSLISGSLPFGQLVTNLIDHGLSVDVLVQALEQKGVARRLAEPNLVALSGDTASFLAGGEFPIPVAADNGQVSVEFKKFGVGLDFTPTVLDNGLINLQIAPEVSQIDPTASVRFNNIEIPGLIVRRAKTTVELRDGQSFVLAGLLQSTGNYDLRKFPWLGDIPILGALFRSSSYRKAETDLVIIVTPRLVHPLAPGARIASPLDGAAPPNDVDLFWNGRTEISRANLRRLAKAEIWPAQGRPRHRLLKINRRATTMAMTGKRTMSALSKICLIAAVGLTLGGCEQYLARQDFIEPYTGDAVRQNLAVQTPDPWPRSAYFTGIPTDGYRQEGAIKKYRTYHEDAPAQQLQPLQLVVPQQ